MPLKLMYITNDPIVAKIAEEAGVDRIFIDMEYIGKEERQGGLDTVKSHHTFDDIKRVKGSLTSTELLVRINPIHEALLDYPSSKEEVDRVVYNGADIIMLPYFKTVKEVETLIKYVEGRVKIMLLVETPEAVNVIDDVLKLDGIDEIHIGLNDLSLGYNKKFMFELLCDGTVEMLSKKIVEKGIPFGFGGIASLGKGMLPAEKIILEHYRLGSSFAILSRTFCNAEKSELEVIKRTFDDGIRDIRKFEAQISKSGISFEDNLEDIKKTVNKIVESKQ